MEEIIQGDIKLWNKALSLQYDLDKILAIFGIILSFLLIIWGGLSVKLGDFLYGVLILISCVLWLVMRKNDHFNFHSSSSGSRVKFWAICFFILYILNILTVYLNPNLYERPLLYFILTALMAGVLACETITAERRHIGFVLIQVLLLGVNIAWTQVLITPGLVGIDPWYHSYLTNRILNESFIPMAEAYSNLPIFHLMIAATSLLTTLPYKLATMVSVSLAQIACNAVFIFLIANYLLKNHRIGLLAALLVIIADMHILNSYWSIPTSFAAVFIPIILYLAFIRIKDTPQLVVSILLIITMVSVVLTHTIVTMSMAIILFVAWGSLAFYKFFYLKIEDNIKLLVPVGFAIGMLAWWIYMTGHIVLLARFFGKDQSLFFARGSFQNSLTFYDWAVVPSSGEIIFSSLGSHLFYSIALIGVFYMVSRKGNKSTYLIAVISLVFLSIPFIAYIAKSEILGNRWSYITQILFSIPLALTLYLVGTWKIKKPIFHYCFFLGFVVVVSFFMLMSPYGNNDNRFINPIMGNINFYTQSEITGGDFFTKKTTGLLSADGKFDLIFNHVYTVSNLQNPLEITSNSGKSEKDDSVKIFMSSYFLEHQRKGLFSSKARLDLNSYLSKSGSDKIYDSSAMTGYIG
jgi:hypothetical protein